MELTIDQALLKAIEAHKSGKLPEAERLYKAILAVQPTHPDANHNLGVLAVGVGKPAEALPYLKAALDNNRTHGQFWVSYINALIEAKQVIEANKVLEEAKKIGLSGESVQKLEQKISNRNQSKKFTQVETKAKRNQSKAVLGKSKKKHSPTQNEINDLLSSYNSGDLGRTEQIASNMTQIYPNYAFGWKVLGAVYKLSGKLKDALEPVCRAVQLLPLDPEAHSNLGVTLKALGRLAEAEASYRKALSIKPDYAEAHNNLGNTLKALGRLAEAEASFREALRIKPDYAEAHSNLGVTLKDLGRLAEAEASFREALRIKPDYAEAHSNLGVTLKDLGRLAGAEASYREALRIKPDYAQAHSNLGATLQDLGRLAEAEASYHEAVRIKPDSAIASFNLGILFLLTGQYNNGFLGYENRWDGSEKSNVVRRSFIKPLWLGKESLVNKAILIHAEQGLGDTIQFCRYIKMVRDLGAKVIFEVQPALMALLSDIEGIDMLIAKGEQLPDFDYHCPLLSLPLAFNTDIDSIPAAIPYLSADTIRIERWSKYLGEEGFKIGICWKGANKERSIPLDAFTPLAKIPGVRLISLQKGDGEKDLKNLPEGMCVESLGNDFDTDAAFMDTAAVMKCCDLIVTNDTSVGHLAGAMGLPTWLALLFVPHWVWMMDRTDSPWYPQHRLFRQKTRGDWQQVLNDMELALRLQLEEKK